jgi:hypothetical protein
LIKKEGGSKLPHYDILVFKLFPLFRKQSKRYKHLGWLIKHPRQIEVCAIEERKQVRVEIRAKKDLEPYAKIAHGKKNESDREYTISPAQLECEDDV